ncbi:MAG: rhomboid family intramembrane serine protease [Planctomycetes bacterium]|nr:rhomboid family intramembrane serine protease [Planctomycetota bacterium]
MAPWDETTPATERFTFSYHVTCTNILIGISLLSLGAAVLARPLGYPDPTGALAFTSEAALHRFQVWRFLTYSFAHALEPGPLIGFALCSFILYRWGHELEWDWGWPRFLAFYLGAAAYGALAHATFQALTAQPVLPALDGYGPALAVMLAHAFQPSKRPVLFLMLLPIPPLLAFALSLGAAVLVSAGFIQVGTSPFTVAGASLAGWGYLVLDPRMDRLLDAWEIRRTRSRTVREAEAHRDVDRLLDKIQRTGMASLSARERRILKRASRYYGRRQHG